MLIFIQSLDCLVSSRAFLVLKTLSLYIQISDYGFLDRIIASLQFPKLQILNIENILRIPGWDIFQQYRIRGEKKPLPLF